VSSTLPERQEALQGVSSSFPIIVYCQSAGCRYADEVAAFLKFNGYPDISIYRGGYREWSREMGPVKGHSSAEGVPTAKEMKGG
jgi:rhodanese-related sulfurtransferase